MYLQTNGKVFQQHSFCFQKYLKFSIVVTVMELYYPELVKKFWEKNNSFVCDVNASMKIEIQLL